ncbi:hypothetical protein, partial [Peribacillus kribbensis]|uniref:hypothetical protein n=1 Tax=Peribacillus kribbensis TaxID=356658 RepID=UPI001C55E7C4
RIQNILKTYRVSTMRHLEIKISEAGPPGKRVEPAVLHDSLKSLIKHGKVQVLQNTPMKIIGAADFGKPGDKSRLTAFIKWHDMFLRYSQLDHYCGLVLEKMLFDSFDISNYHIIGSSPILDEKGLLVKPTNSEVLFYGGKKIYKHEDGNGFDQFLIHKQTDIPVGIEAKNIRQWIYPASLEVWRMIARACTLECLPVLVSRKISYITLAGFFSHFGVLGFRSHFQYFANAVNADSKYRFKPDVIAKERLGFADIKLIKPNDPAPKHFGHFFNTILPENIEVYYEKFMKNKELLAKYAIEKGMAENSLSQGKRYALYLEFKEEAEYEDIDFEDDNDD